MAAKKTFDEAGNEITTKAQRKAVETVSSESSFTNDLVDAPHNVRPVDPGEENWSNPGDLLPHVRHFEYLNSVLGEATGRVHVNLQSNIDPETRALRGQRRKDALDKFTEARKHLNEHLIYHSPEYAKTRGLSISANPQRAYYHLKNAADAIHDGVILLRKADRDAAGGGSSLDDTFTSPSEEGETGAPISFAQLNRTKAKPSLGIFDKLASAVNDYGNKLGVSASPVSYSRSFSSPEGITVPRSSPVSPRDLIPEAEPTEVVKAEPKNPVVVTRTDPKFGLSKATAYMPAPEALSPGPIPNGMSPQKHDEARQAAFQHWLANDTTINSLLGGIKNVNVDTVTKMAQSPRNLVTKKGSSEAFHPLDNPHGYLANIGKPLWYKPDESLTRREANEQSKVKKSIRTENFTAEVGGDPKGEKDWKKIPEDAYSEKEALPGTDIGNVESNQSNSSENYESDPDDSWDKDTDTPTMNVRASVKGLAFDVGRNEK
jgi:hypothetical protein